MKLDGGRRESAPGKLRLATFQLTREAAIWIRVGTKLGTA